MKTGSKQALSGPLEGTWYVKTLEVDGQPMPAGMLGEARIVIQGDQFQSLGMGAVYEGIMNVDESASPKAFDLTFTAGPEKGNTALAIYEMEGEQWKLCLTTRGGPRPTQFATRPGTGHAFETLSRTPAVRTAEPVAAAATAPPSGAATELEGEWSMVSGFMDGEAIEPRMVKYAKRTTRGNQTTVQFGPQVFLRATFALDAAASPRTIDLVHTEGMHQGRTQLGIYECDGATFRLSASAPGAGRPTDFEPRKGDGKTVAVWKLSKK